MTGRSREAETTDVIVVGAGPVGLLLAGELRLGGAKVIVLERLPKPMTESRASTLHARTMEVLDSRGILSEIEPPPSDRMGHFGGLPLELTLPSKYAGQWKVAQTRLERILHDWASSAGADIRRGCEVVDLCESPDSVVVEATRAGDRIRVRGRYLVACDGERSDVRRLTGADFPRTPGAPEPGSERILYRADITGVVVASRRFQQLDGGLAIAARLPSGVTRVMVCEVDGPSGKSLQEGVSFAAVADAWWRVTGEDIRAAEVHWVNAFSDASHQLRSYRAGRILWAGDAAHRQLPTGGQAINLGLQDAFNLGWKLALCARGRAPEALLDTYHRERHAVGARVLANIRAQATLLLGGPGMAPLRKVTSELIALEDVRAALARAMSGLDIRYDVGPGGHPMLGERMPDVDLVTASGKIASTALLRRGRGLLLTVAESADRREQLAACVAPWCDAVRFVVASFAREGESVRPRWSSGADALLVRPDGYIAWTDAEDGDLRGALSRWFGPPTQTREGSSDSTRIMRIG